MRDSISDPKATAEQRLEALRREDKWYLSDGRGTVWAPPFPLWLREPGFWDPAHVYDVPVGPLFSVALVADDGHAIQLYQTARSWRPDALTCTFTTRDGGELTERRELLPAGRFISSWAWRGLKQPAYLVAFSAQPANQTRSIQRADDGCRVSWLTQAPARGGGSMDLEVALSARTRAPGCTSSAVQRCENKISQPVWAITPFTEVWQPGTGLRPMDLSEGIDNCGLDWVALSVGIGSQSDGPDVLSFEFSAQPVGATPVAPGRGRDHWHRYFDSYPRFMCSNEYLDRYYDYRLYGLHLCEVRGPVGHLKHPAVAEGIEYFHVPISYSGQCHMLETRWSHTPDTARGTLLNFLDNQKPDGSLHGRIYTSGQTKTDFYHANWGDALAAVDAVQPDRAFLERACDGLGRYLGWLTATRDREQSGAVDIINHFEAGQEYMSRYQAVNASADVDGWANRTRLKGVDVTVYAYQLASTLGALADRLGRNKQANAYHRTAEQIGDAIQTRMWDPATTMYSDLDPADLRRTGVKAAVCFYPMLTDLPTAEQVRALLVHLKNPDEFATPWPAPSSSVDDPHFDPHARWQGKRHLCPWNGRVWPMTNSHIIEGLIRQWKRRAAVAPGVDCGELAGQWLMSFTRMMFHQGDPTRPNCFEHYNPYTGQPCTYRGIDDYQHSWVVDLVMTGVLGIGVETDRAGAATLRVDPLPMAIEQAGIEGVRVRGYNLSVSRVGERYEVELNGERFASTIGEPMTLGLPERALEPVILDAGRTPPPLTPARPVARNNGLS